MNKKLTMSSNIYDLTESYPNSEFTGFGYEIWVYKGETQLGYFDSLTMCNRYPLTYKDCESAIVSAHHRVEQGFLPLGSELTPI